MTKPRWSDDEPVEPHNGLSSAIVERVDHAGKMFKHSTVCQGQNLRKLTTRFINVYTAQTRTR